MEIKKLFLYLFALPDSREPSQQVQRYPSQILMSCEVFEARIVPKSHYADIWKGFGKQILEPHDFTLLMSPGIDCISIKSMNCNQAAL